MHGWQPINAQLRGYRGQTLRALARQTETGFQVTAFRERHNPPALIGVGSTLNLAIADFERRVVEIEEQIDYLCTHRAA